MAQPFSSARCPRCAAPVAPTLTCTKPACIAWERARAHHARQADRKARSAERVQPMMTAAVAQTGAAARDAVVTGIVPHSSAAIRPHDPVQRQAFLAAIKAMIECAFAQPLPPPDPETLAQRDADEQPSPAALTIGCIGCRGYCCHNAQDRNAFLTEETFVLQRQREPDLSAERLFARYVSALPDDSQHKSCVYHGAMGCTLPRSLRADLCNTYFCPEQQLIAQQLQRLGTTRAAIVALNDAHESAPQAGAAMALAVSLDASGTIRVHNDLTLGALPAPHKDR